MHGITFNPVTVNRLNYSNKQVQNNQLDDIDYEYTMSGASILANQNLALLTMNSVEKDENKIPKYDKSLVADEAEGHNSYYLRNNPEGFYIKNGAMINNFLRTGELKPILEREEDVSDLYKDIVAQDVREVQDYNRAIVDSVEILDDMMVDVTKEPVVVYRYAPTSWLDTKNDEGIIKDEGFFSTTTKKGGYIEDSMDMKDRTCFEVLVPEGTPYLDLTDSEGSEMLFPRGLEFSVLDNRNLEMLSKE